MTADALDDLLDLLPQQEQRILKLRHGLTVLFIPSGTLA